MTLACGPSAPRSASCGRRAGRLRRDGLRGPPPAVAAQPPGRCKRCMGESGDDGAAAERQVNIYEELLRDLAPVRVPQSALVFGLAV